MSLSGKDMLHLAGQKEAEEQKKRQELEEQKKKTTRTSRIRSFSRIERFSNSFS